MIEDALAAYDAAIEDFALLAEQTRHDGTRLGAIRGRLEATIAKLGLMASVGILRRNLGRLALEFDVRKASTAAIDVRDTARAMSQENVELVRRGYEALNRGELRPESFGAEFEIVEPSEQPGAETRQGPKGVSDSMAALSEAFDDLQYQPERFIDSGDKVAALLRVRGRGKGSGIVVESKVAHVWTLQDRKPVRVEVYMDVAQAVTAVGLSEQGTQADS